MINQYCYLIELLVQGLSCRTNKVFQSRRNWPTRNVPCIAQPPISLMFPQSHNHPGCRHTLCFGCLFQSCGGFSSVVAFPQVNVLWFVPTTILEMLRLPPRLACMQLWFSHQYAYALHEPVSSSPASSFFFFPIFPPTPLPCCFHAGWDTCKVEMQ